MLNKEIMYMIKSDDSSNYEEEFTTAFIHECNNDDETYQKKGRAMLKAIANNDLNAFIIAATGWAPDSILMKAMLIRDKFPFHDGLIEGEISTARKSTKDDVWFPCTINPETHEVVSETMDWSQISKNDELRVSFDNAYGQPCEFACRKKYDDNSPAFYIISPKEWRQA